MVLPSPSAWTLSRPTKCGGFKPLSELLAIAKSDGDMTMADRHADRLQVRLIGYTPELSIIL